MAALSARCGWLLAVLAPPQHVRMARLRHIAMSAAAVSLPVAGAQCAQMCVMYANASSLPYIYNLGLLRGDTLRHITPLPSLTVIMPDMVAGTPGAFWSLYSPPSNAVLAYDSGSGSGGTTVMLVSPPPGYVAANPTILGLAVQGGSLLMAMTDDSEDWVVVATVAPDGSSVALTGDIGPSYWEHNTFGGGATTVDTNRSVVWLSGWQEEGPSATFRMAAYAMGNTSVATPIVVWPSPVGYRVAEMRYSGLLDALMIVGFNLTTGAAVIMAYPLVTFPAPPVAPTLLFAFPATSAFDPYHCQADISGDGSTLVMGFANVTDGTSVVAALDLVGAKLLYVSTLPPAIRLLEMAVC